MNSVLEVDDYVGISFWFATAVMLASTIFFILERQDVKKEWKTSLTIASIITGIAFWHYLYMREVWILTKETPIVLRYVDWIITVPLQIIEFYLILSAVTIVRSSLFWKFLISSTLMLVFGYLGETKTINETFAFSVGLVSWLYIVYDIFVGESSKINKNSGNPSSQFAFHAMKWIVSVGWSIYPLGYVFGYLIPSVDINSLNIIYNIADLVNKTAFGLAIWYAASSASLNDKD
ncbi:MAG: biphenyl 2,3-dioxygenase [Zetaproteobacteria bacterium]|nr:biphenyl 2,3-dioxygenase [Pseudobdellovibrionaceae bacterium]|tara:strand:- start:362 stop:1063 length:702 start_codon:yes stop_codon:yes gene_type:complete